MDLTCKLNITPNLFLLVTFVLPDTSFNSNPKNGFRRNPDHWPHRFLGMIPTFVCLAQHKAPFLTVVYDRLGLAVGLARMSVCAFMRGCIYPCQP